MPDELSMELNNSDVFKLIGALVRGGDGSNSQKMFIMIWNGLKGV